MLYYKQTHQTCSFVNRIFHILLIRKEAMNEVTEYPCGQQIKKLLNSIQNVTVQMSNTFEQAIVKHEEQFIRTYKLKIIELTKLFDELTKVLEDKFVNNELTTRLNIVMKERDYFKYECLKLNVQYQTVINEHNSHSGQIATITDQMKIYKHLLEDEKLKNKELEQQTQKIKTNFSELAFKTLSQTIDCTNPRPATNHEHAHDFKNKKMETILNQLHDKNETIRNLKIKLSQLEVALSDNQTKFIEKKELYETFKACVNSWKRNLITKQRRTLDGSLNASKTVWNPEKLSVATKQELLRYFFTNPDFLDFLQKLMFHPSFKIQFVEVNPQNHKYMNDNRAKLYDYMRKKKIVYPPPFY